MTKFKTFKLIGVLSALVCVVACVVLFHKVTDSLAIEMKQSAAQIEQVRMAGRIYDYLQITDRSASATSNAINNEFLRELMGSKANRPRNSIHIAAFNQIQSDLKHQIKPDATQVNLWLSGVLYNTILDQEANYQTSQDNMAPAIVFTNRRWLIWLLIIAASAFLATFSCGILYIKNYQRNHFRCFGISNK